MKTRTLYISDLDGTLLDSNSIVTSHSVENINLLLQKGMLFTIATARTPATVVPLLKQLQLDLPVVLMNGAVLYDIRNKHYIQTNGFTDDSALRYISILENRDLIPFVYRIENNKLQVFHKPLVNDIQRDFKYKRENTPYKDFIPTDNYTAELTDNPPLFMLVIDRFDKLETAAAEITRAGNCSVFCYRDIAVPDYGNLEIYPKGVSKAATAQLIIDRINPWEVVAFGDNLNDLPLFNLADRRYAPANATEEIKRQATAIIPDNDHDILETLPGPDFSTGGELLFDEAATREIYSTGRGSFKLRAKWRYVKDGNLIEITEIPYTTATEVIMDKVAELIKAGKIKEIADMRDETDLGGLKLTIDLKRGVDPEKLMQKLFRLTPLQDSFPCNFNILIAGMPRVMGVGEILDEWTAWRTDCVKRRIFFQIQKKEDRLHLLKGLERILLDIDKAIAIIRETELENEVVPNLMIGFGIDEIQANYVAEIKLRNINKEYILKQTRAIDDLEGEIADLRDTLNSPRKLKNVIIKELQAVADKFGQPRRTEILYDAQETAPEEEDDVPDYGVTVFVSKEGYLKKMTAQSLRMSGEQKFKEGDSLSFSQETTNRAEFLVVTDRYQCYKSRLSDFDDGKASQLGDYLPQKLGFEVGENLVALVFCGDYKGFILFFFENGKAAKVPLSAYETKTNRKKLTGAYSDKSPLIKAVALDADEQMVVYSTDGRAAIFSTAQLLPKTTRNTQGVAVMNMKPRYHLDRVCTPEESGITNLARYRVRSIPAAGALLREEDQGREQMSLL